MKLTEDDIYRSSTQFKHWSFAPSALAKQRLETNIQASERVRAAVARQRAARALESQPVSESENGGSTPQTGSNTPIPRVEGEVHCLTVAEEKRLVDTFCERALELGNFLKFPIEVTVRRHIGPE
jgi:cyclin H